MQLLNITFEKTTTTLSLIFLVYGISFIFLLRKQKEKVYLSFTLATIASLCMYFYHATSSLNLNF
jgi:hypothetical protein